MFVNRITKRWFFNVFIVILIVLIFIELLVIVGIKNFYYNSVRKFVDSQSMAILNLMEKNYHNSAINYESEIRYIVENFSQKDKMELMILNDDGDVLMSSNGFQVEKIKNAPDYNFIKMYKKNNKIINSVEKIYSLNSENVMAITYLVPYGIKDINYIRFITGIGNVDKQIVVIIAMTTLIGISIILFVVISSSYFIQSIVVPVGEIGKTAEKISQGDFKTRLENKNNDEIGDLCKVINHMAEELLQTEKMKNEFISSVSHELRTPLTAIKGWAETINICGVEDQDMVQKGMKVIISETNRLSGMVEELLDFSRMQNGNIKLVLAKLDIITELKDIILVFKERAKKEEINFKYQFPDDCIYIMGDRNRLRQVFINIIDNSMKYSGKGKQVDISVGKSDGFALINISDNGCGINSDDLPKIKNKFYKANYSKRGSGIGLAVADEIIKLHDGIISIYSLERKGTTVVIQIPIYSI